jgi:alpha-acetolactate decarboxylase
MTSIGPHAFRGLLVLTGVLGGLPVAAHAAEAWDGKLVQYGRMHEAIGLGQHQGRVSLGALLERPHFFGVAALERLEGEATVHDGRVTLTRVDAAGRLAPSDPPALETQATLVVGAYVPSWTTHEVAADVGPDAFDQAVAELAARAGVATSAPFVFTVEGELGEVRLHVINGACPLHARLRKTELPKDRQPFELERDRMRGTLVGVFAKDAVGSITHPATSTHAHLLFQDPASGKRVTGHVERVGMLAGAVVRLPARRRASRASGKLPVRRGCGFTGGGYYRFAGHRASLASGGRSDYLPPP